MKGWGADRAGKERDRKTSQAHEFAPGLLAIEESPPRRLPRTVLYVVLALCGVTLLWMVFGKLDITATAEGRLVPKTYVQIVQPAHSGIVDEILVHEDEHVRAGQILMRMDPHDADADTAALKAELALDSLKLRRIDAELGGGALARRPDDPGNLYAEVDEQLRADRSAYGQARASARAALDRARRAYAAAQQVLAKLEAITPILKEQAAAYDGMGQAGYVPRVLMQEKDLKYLEKAQDLRAQQDTVRGRAAAVEEARARLAAVRARYRARLRAAWMATYRDDRKLKRAWANQLHADALLALRAPQAGVIQEVATHTVGTVVSPGTVLASLVPDHEPLVAVVRIRNRDIGFVYPHQKVRVKIGAYPFEKYGWIGGQVRTLSPDAARTHGRGRMASDASPGSGPGGARASYRAVIALTHQSLRSQNRDFRLVPGMEVSADIDEGRWSVLDYILSPVEKTLENSGSGR